MDLLNFPNINAINQYPLPPSVLLDEIYSFAGIDFKSHQMLFVREDQGGSHCYKRLSFEEGLSQPIDMIEPDLSERYGTLEMILYHKARRDTRGHDMRFEACMAIAKAELQFLFGYDVLVDAR